MQLRFLRAGLILGVFLLSLIITMEKQVFGQSSIYGYGYLHIAPYGDATEIRVVSPDAPHRLISSHPFPLPEGWIFSPRFRSEVSPNGRWIASTLFAVDQSRLMIHLLDIETWQSHQLIEGYLTNNGQSLVWSPDGRYLAINIRQTEQQDLDLFIYDIRDGNIIDLSNDTADQRDIGWALDSRHVLTFSHPCSPRESCSDHLEIYAVEDAVRMSSIDLIDFPFLGTSACNPKASPDIRNVSVISNCGIGIPFSSDFPSEIYLWSRDRDRLTQVTNYAQGQVGFLAEYQHEWLDNQTLLIGLNYRIGNNPEQLQLASHRLDSGILEVLSSSFGSGFALDKGRQQILLEESLIFTDQTRAGETIQVGFDVLSSGSTIETGASSTEVFFACESYWSPDGEVVVITTSRRDCNLFVEGLIFISPSTQISATYTLDTEIDPDAYNVRLGWLRL